MPRTAVMFDDPSYVVLNIPSPAADIVKDVRHRFNPKRAEYPVEVSVSGSNGVGSIIPGQDTGRIFDMIDTIAAGLKPFRTSFREVKCFPGSNIFYFTMNNEAEFLKIHSLVASSGIKFTPNQFPYEPHCTICLNSALSNKQRKELLNMKVPDVEFVINTISVYELNSADDGQLLHRCNFGLE